MRRHYFDAELDIGSSGVEEYSMAELRSRLDLDDLDAIVFRDSPTLGSRELREAIAARIPGAHPDRIVATHGSSEAIFLAMHAILAPGDEVVVLSPCYQQLQSTAEAIGCRIRHWALRADNGFRPDLDDLRRLMTAGVRMVVVNFPHNPSGVTLTPGEQDELVNLCARSGAYLVWDAAFAELVYDRPVLPDPSTRWERAVSLGTLSKAYGLPGLRVGWCVAPRALLDRFLRIRDYTTLHLSPLIEAIARRALERADELLQPRLTLARANLTILSEWVSGRGDVTWQRPSGGVCALVGLTGVGDTEKFCRVFCETQKTLIVPGSCFGLPQYIRVGFGKRGFQAGLERLDLFRASWPSLELAPA
ncbi:MAG: capreomycidine synthase [Vicinamibacterales bacterium]